MADKKHVAMQMIKFLHQLTIQGKLDWIRQEMDDAPPQYQVELGKELPSWDQNKPVWYTIVLSQSGAGRTLHYHFGMTQGNSCLYALSLSPSVETIPLSELFDAAKERGDATVSDLERFIKELSK